MGLFDFLRVTRRKEKVVRRTEIVRHETIGGVPMTLAATTRLSVVDSDEDYPTPPNTLRDLKQYNESVRHPCGFDLSSVRRSHGERGVWWLEGSNFERATEALSRLQSFEDEARLVVPDFPRAIEYVLGGVRPYSRGEDGNVVPTIETSETKSRGHCIRAFFRYRPSELRPMCNATVYFCDDGKVVEANVGYFTHDDRWRMRVTRSKKTGILSLSSATKGQ